jgi:hypothetical protein
MMYRYLRYEPVAFVLFAAMLTGCSDGSPAETESGPGPAVSSGAAASGAGLEFEAPSTWIDETPSSSMRLAQYRLPRLEGDPEDAELAVFYFGGQGGSVQANVDRWIGQFSNPDGSPVTSPRISEKDANGIPLTIVDVRGTYHQAQGPMMAQSKAKENYRMLAAVAEGPAGPSFFKLTGPRPTVDHFEESFNSFLDTLRLSQ